jgi:hypothetical protein
MYDTYAKFQIGSLLIPIGFTCPVFEEVEEGV